MANNYNGITTEAYSIVTDNKTLAVVPRLLPHPAENEFQKILNQKESKIRFQIQDRRGGTGKEYSVYFNFSLVDWASLYDIIMKITTDAQVNPAGMYDFASKQYVRIYHQFEAAGPYQGLCHSIHASWKRESMKNGSPSKSPWILTIIDGYAKGANGKNKGSFYEVANTFKPNLTGMFYFTDEDLKALAKYVQAVIDLNLEIIGKPRITAGWEKYLALKAQGTHNGMRGNPQMPQMAQMPAVAGIPPVAPASAYAGTAGSPPVAPASAYAGTAGIPPVAPAYAGTAQVPQYTPVQTTQTAAQPPANVPAYAPVQPTSTMAPPVTQMPGYAPTQATQATQAPQMPPQMPQTSATSSAPTLANGMPTKPYKGIIKSIAADRFVLRFLEYQGHEGTVFFSGELPQAAHVAARSGAEKTFYLSNDSKGFYFGGMA